MALLTVSSLYLRGAGVSGREHICALLRRLVKHTLGDFGYQRSRWSTKLMAIKINEITGCQVHAGTLRRWLPAIGLVWRRAATTLRIRDPHREEKMAEIHQALEKCSAENPVFLRLGDVIERCRASHSSNYIINTTRRSKKGDTSLHPDVLTKAFVKSRNASTLDLGDNPPTFHEIRSLASRLYSLEKGEEFA